MDEVVVSSFATRVEALLAVDLLRDEGIPSVIVPLGAGAAAWGNSEWVPHALRVRAVDVERARDLLEPADDEDSE